MRHGSHRDRGRMSAAPPAPPRGTDPSSIVRLSTPTGKARRCSPPTASACFDCLADGFESVDEVGRVCRSIGAAPGSYCGRGRPGLLSGRRTTARMPGRGVFWSAQPRLHGHRDPFTAKALCDWDARDALRSGKPALPAEGLPRRQPGSYSQVRAGHARAGPRRRPCVVASSISRGDARCSTSVAPGTFPFFSRALTASPPRSSSCPALRPWRASSSPRPRKRPRGAARWRLPQQRLRRARTSFDVGHVPSRDGAGVPHLIARAAACWIRWTARRERRLTDPGGRQPTFAAMFGMNMMLTGARWRRALRRRCAGLDGGEAAFAICAVVPLPPPMPHGSSSG